MCLVQRPQLSEFVSFSRGRSNRLSVPLTSVSLRNQENHLAFQNRTSILNPGADLVRTDERESIGLVLLCLPHGKSPLQMATKTDKSNKKQGLQIHIMFNAWFHLVNWFIYESNSYKSPGTLVKVAAYGFATPYILRLFITLSKLWIGQRILNCPLLKT